MNFEPTEDRRMLSDTLRRFLGDEYGWEHRNAVAYDAPFRDPDLWAQLVELGVLLALVPEEQGGFGGAGFDIATVFEALGRAICPEPVLPALMAARLLGAAGEDPEPLMTGAIAYAVGIGELDAPYDMGGIAAEATRDGDGWRVSGRKSVVYGGHVADRLLVAARNGDGLSVLAVEAADAEVIGYGLIDGGGAAEIVLDGAPARMLIEDGTAALADALDAGTLALCAEAVGALDVAYETTLDYLRTRKQFGASIGGFQALQHRMVDLMGEIEQARSITILAASRLGGPEGPRTVSMAKSLIGRTARLCAEEAVQMHGGIGITWEHPISHYAKRLVMIDHQLGDTDWHLERVMEGLDAA